VALGLGLVGMMMAAGTLRLDQMVDLQTKTLFGVSGLPAWGIFLQPVGFVLFFAAAFAETKRAPFDLPEGESEIIGYFLEYSGMKFGTFMISEFVEVVTLSGILTAIFFGGYHLGFFNLDAHLQNLVTDVVRARFAATPAVIEASAGLTLAIIGATIFALKVILLCWLQLVIRWTFPRFRYDQIQWLGWRILLPIGLVNIFVTGACLLWDKSLDLLGAVGLCEIAVFIGLALWQRAPGATRKSAPVPAPSH
jgi:NADH-quinone oxidoreductase subunit H